MQSEVEIVRRIKKMSFDDVSNQLVLLWPMTNDGLIIPLDFFS
jgi:hypothetical protein